MLQFTAEALSAYKAGSGWAHHLFISCPYPVAQNKSASRAQPCSIAPRPGWHAFRLLLLFTDWEHNSGVINRQVAKSAVQEPPHNAAGQGEYAEAVGPYEASSDWNIVVSLRQAE